MENEDLLKNRKDRIIKWLRNPYNLSLAGILLVAFAIRLYYFYLTRDQAVWWDEGEYMLRVKSIVLGTPSTGFFVGRELFTPYFWAGLYFFFKSEILIRFVQVIISTLTVWVTYSLGKEVYDRKTGLLASLFMAFFWLHLFFTCRLLTYLYAPLIYILALALFWKGYYTEDKHKDRYLYLSFVTIIIGLGIYSSVVLAALTILIYLLITEKISFLWNKRLWKYGLLSLPFLLFSLIPSYFVQGSFIPRLTQIAQVKATETGAGLAGYLIYPSMMPRLLLPIFLWIMILALIAVVGRIILSFDLILKNKQVGRVKNDLYIFLVGLIPFWFYSWYSTISGGPAGASYDAWILPVFPAIFVLMSRFIIWIKRYTYSKTTNSTIRKVVVILLILIICFGLYMQIKDADVSIKGKVESYYNLKPAGAWLKENTVNGDTIAASPIPEITYYAERATYALREYETEEEFIKKVIDVHKPKYILVSAWEWEKNWTYGIQNSKLLNLTVANVYFVDSARTQPDVVIYKINY